MEVRSKKKPQQTAQPAEEKKPVQQEQPASEFEPEPEQAEQGLMQILTTLRDIHEGGCIVTLLVTDNTITIQSTQKVIVGEQK